MTTLSSALAAMDKATPEKWAVERNDCYSGTLTEIYSEDEMVMGTRQKEDEPIIDVALDALIARAKE